MSVNAATDLGLVPEETTTSLSTVADADAELEESSSILYSDSNSDCQETMMPARSIDSFMDDAFDATTIDLGRMTWTSYTKTFVRQWNYWALVLCMGVCNSSDATEILALSYVLGLGEKSDFASEILENDLSRNGGVLAGSIFLGMLIGGGVVGIFGDVYGRKKILLSGLILNGSAGVLSATAVDLITLASARFVAGIGIGGSIPPLFALAAEIAPRKCRGLVISIIASFWMVGSIFTSVLAFCSFGLTRTLSWRIFLTICSFPSIIGAALVYYNVPESPRFLLRTGRSYESAQITNKLAQKIGYHCPFPLTPSELSHNLDELPYTENETSRNFIAVSRDGIIGVLSLYNFDIKVCQTTLVAQSIWFTISFGSYGLITWINAIFRQINLGNIYFDSLLFSFSNLPGNILSASLVDRYGRKNMLITSLACASLSVLLFAFSVNLSDKESIRPYLIVFCACSFQAFSVSGWNIIGVLTSESFPTKVRSTGVGICSSSGRIGSMVAQLVNGALIDQPSRLLLVSATLLLAGAIVTFYLPQDMSMQPLQDSYVTPSISTTHEGSFSKRRKSDGYTSII
uniref:Major facilitator superfamily (MFS) profile domain-containing protein n=1 Tax=Leptocylindrus aporus TaxID=1398097 RepID=A0A7S0K9W7_9STRA|mmetsp:Transcript_241/g.277  ORF Transcript_241/g.277 Transcript_241/m.277 type:complete len:574 (+) Transcript_241:220-1941(+)